MSSIANYFDKLHDRAGKVASNTAKWLDLNYGIDHVSVVKAENRFDICKCCVQLRDDKTCAICRCDMEYKTTLKHNPFDLSIAKKEKQLVVCPIGKW